MNWRRALMVAASSAGCVLMTAATAGPPASAAGPALTTSARPKATQSPPGHVGAAIPVPGLAALNASGAAAVTFMQCPEPGFCTAAGSYADGSNHLQAFVVTEVNFVWGQATPIVVPGHASPGHDETDITALSCPTAAYCMAGGSFIDTAGNLQPFIIESTNGVFGSAKPMFTVNDQVSQGLARVTAISCVMPTDCTVAVSQPVPVPGGGPADMAFLAIMTAGQWGALQSVTGFSDSADLPEVINSVSCWDIGDCMAVGYYTTSHNLTTLPLLAIHERGQDWSAQGTIPGLNGPAVLGFDSSSPFVQGDRVSCWAATSCTVEGHYFDTHANKQAFVADWVNGSWTTQTLPGSTELNTVDDLAITALSCGADGNCAIAGFVNTDPFDDPHPTHQAIVDSRVAGTWQTAQEIDGIDTSPDSEAFAAACPVTGSCLAGGYYKTADGIRSWIAEENTTPGTSFGSFGAAQQVAGNLNSDAFLEAISCSNAGECGFGGSYTPQLDDFEGFLGDLSAATAVTLTASATTVASSNEHRLDFTATVTPQTGGTPTGTVDVLASVSEDPICTITLVNGTGSCQPPAGSLAPGAHTFLANYNGNQVYGSSTTAADGQITVHVLAKALTTTTTLRLSAVKIKVGHEQTEKFTARVTPEPGAALTGRITIKAGSTRLCRVPLNHGQAHCILTARKLRPGTYQITARYGGDVAHAPSKTPAKKLTVTKR